MEQDDAKYTVFKTEEFDAWAQTNPPNPNPLYAVDDAVVIRLKDPYASSALHAYTNAILTVLDIMEDHLDPEEYQRQLDIADYFHQQAVASGEIKNKRMPD